jgi:hypothetical protein
MRNPFRRIDKETHWELHQRASAPSRYYGDGGTIHSTGYLDVETHKGTVCAVWFRCQMLPFKQFEVDGERAGSMEDEIPGLPILTGVEVYDQEREMDCNES